MAEKTYKKLYEMTLPGDRSSLDGLKKIIDNLPSLNNTNIQINDSKLKEYNSQNFSFIYPSSFNLTKTQTGIALKDKSSDFVIQMDTHTLPDGVSVKSYLDGQKTSYGFLVNQGLAQIPTTDYAYVRLWNDNNIQKMQFFLFKNDKVLEILVYPFNTSNMKVFDKIIESLEF